MLNFYRTAIELNKKYGESFGYHRTAAEWYDTLISKSRAYCEQIGYEAQAKVLASQIAAKQLEKETKQSEHYQLGQQYWDGNGNVHHNYENAAGGKDYYEQLGTQISQISNEIGVLQRQYDSAINHVIDAQKQLDASKRNTQVSVNKLNASTTDEIKQEIEQLEKQKSALLGSDDAERQRLNRRIGVLQKELKRRDAQDKKEQGLDKATQKKTIATPRGSVPEKPIDNAHTLEDIGKNISYYENQLKKTNKDDTEKIQSLTNLINKYKELQKAIQSEINAASRPASLDTLEDIDAEILFQHQLRQKASKEKLAQIDAEIRRLNDLKTAFEDSSHVSLGKGQIKTFEQLDAEVSFYERKLKTATETERVEIQKQIKSLRELRGEWEETLGVLDAPADISTLSTMGELDKALSYYGERLRKASSDEIEDIQRTINALQAKRDALARMTELPTMQQKVGELGGLGGKSLQMKLEVIGIEGIKDKIRSLQKMLDDTRNPLGDAQRKEVDQLIQDWSRYEKVLKKSNAKLGDVWAGIKGVGGGVEGITEALKGNGNAWQTITGLVDGAIQVYDGINAVVGIVKQLTQATKASSAATAEDTATTTANTAVTAENAATSATNTTMKSGEAIANATASGAKLAFPANLVAIAAGVAAVVAALSMISGAFAGGGVVGGNSLVGDRLLVRVNSGEMILNAQQQARLFKLANGASVYGSALALTGEYASAKNNPEVMAQFNKLKSIIGENGGRGGGAYEFRVRGRDLVAVLANETRINRKSTNIKI